MAQMLLKAGAEPNEYCPTVYSIPECVESSEGRYVDFGYTTWTPWQSALQSILRTAAGTMKWRYLPLTPEESQDWILVLKDLLARKPDVGVVTWALLMGGRGVPYTVSETIETVFEEKYPEDTKVLLRMVKDLADEQDSECAL